MQIHGYQKNSRFHNSIEISAELIVKNNSLVLNNPLETRLGIFSCHNEITLFVFLASGRSIEPYYVSFFPCRLLRRNEVFLKKLSMQIPDSFFATDETPSYRMDVRVFSSRELHHNWEDPIEKPSSGGFFFEFENAMYRLASIRCMFCFKEWASEEALCQHIGNIHMSFRAVFCGAEHAKEDESSQCETKGHLSRNSSNCFCIKAKKNAKYVFAVDRMMKIVPANRNTMQKVQDRFYFCRRQRKMDRSCRHTFPYMNYLEPETFEPFGTKKLSFPWQKWLVGKRLDEIIDLPEKQVRIIKEWCIFIQGKKVRPSSRNILCYVKEFVDMHNPSFEMFVFITCFYNNAVLSIEEVSEIIMERVL